jgi:rhomboid protease GluP
MKALRHAPVTVALIAANLIVFAAEIFEGVPLWNVGSMEDLAVLDRMGAINSRIAFAGEWWRLFTAMFLHIGLLHLLLNLWALYQLGYVFEMIFGSKRFIFTYLVAGLVASYASFYFIDHPLAISAGASGAIFGILGALILAIRRSALWRYEPWTRSLTKQLLGWAVLNVFIGFTFPGIDNAAHIGGLITGLATALLPQRKFPPPPPRDMVVEVPRGEDPQQSP